MGPLLTVFICYAHVPGERAVVERFVAHLRARGIDPIIDWQIADRNPHSLAHWISRGIWHHPVICLVSRTAIAWYDNEDPTTRHRGIRYEMNQVLRRMYEHTGRDGCPVIPVLMPDTPADLAPQALRHLQLSKITDIDAIVGRIRDAHEHAPRPAVVEPVERGAQPAASARTLEDALRDLRMVGPASPIAPGLVREWLSLARRAGDLPFDSVRIFSAVERIIKAAGDVQLMGEVSEFCLRALEALDLDEAGEREHARWLICGRAWERRRLHRLDEALAITEEGVRIAQEIHDQTLMAKGWRCLSRIHHDIAATAEGERCERHLRLACDSTKRARTMFEAVDAVHELGVCDLVAARIHFTRHRRNRAWWSRRAALRQARVLARTAEERLNQGEPSRERFEAALLRAEIAVASGAVAEAERIADGTLAALAGRAEDGASYAELCGRLHLLRAHLHRDRSGPDATLQVENAEGIFTKLGLDHLVAECSWYRIRHGRDGRFSRWDLRALERLCPDPVERVRVAEGGRRWTTMRGLCGAVGSRNWKKRIAEVRRGEAGPRA